MMRLLLSQGRTLLLGSLCAAFVLITVSESLAQSFEWMMGHERMFGDAQWLRFFDEEERWSMFSRTRATVDYDNQTDLFSAIYLNHTTKWGVGPSVVGKIASGGAGVDGGVHIFKAKSNWMLFGLAATAIKSDFEAYWFSIFRYTPSISEKFNGYVSIELFTLFRDKDHAGSVQRLRLGIDRSGLQYGLAANLVETGTSWQTNHNFGVFIRKSFSR